MKIGSKRDVNRDHKRLTQQDVPKKIVIPAAQHDPPHDLKRLSQNRSDLLMGEHLYSMSAVIVIMNGETDHATNLPLMNHKGGVPKWGHLSYRLHQTFYAFLRYDSRSGLLTKERLYSTSVEIAPIKLEGLTKQ